MLFERTNPENACIDNHLGMNQRSHGVFVGRGRIEGRVLGGQE
jgi:hypothetical protein